ncbi:MAG: hypothetical protein EXR99_08780 [Gemmataceae bacterium]|nr:hypothetical protein [Gemmataceae bacterium]
MPNRSNLLVLLAFFFWACAAQSHPLLSESHDRTIRVSFTPGAVAVDYLLEVDELRAARDISFLPETQRAGIRSREQLHHFFLDFMAGTLAENLVARVGGQPLKFTCVEKSVRYDKHLVCQFRFEAKLPAQLASGEFHFRESNYEDDDFSRLDLGFAPESAPRLENARAPQKDWIDKPGLDRGPGETERLRLLTANLIPSDKDDAVVKQTSEPAKNSSHDDSLLSLLLDDHRGRWLVFLAAALFGGAHALTPGHGKTLAAAYLIGERGTLAHAFLLGLVTTLSHTGGVILLAFLLPRFFPKAHPGEVQTVLGFIGGLMIAGLGAWLLLRRLSGRADHYHGPGGGHTHLPDGTVVVTQPAGWKGIVVLGIAGGIVPCWDAVAMLLFALGANLLSWALPLLLAFSAGLAGVLVAVGVAVVKTRDWLGERGVGARLLERVSRVLPLFSAALVALMGIWLCYSSLPTAGGK